MPKIDIWEEVKGKTVDTVEFNHSEMFINFRDGSSLFIFSEGDKVHPMMHHINVRFTKQELVSEYKDVEYNIDGDPTGK